MPLLSPLRTTADLVARTAWNGAGLALTAARVVSRPVVRRIRGEEERDGTPVQTRPPTSPHTQPGPPVRPSSSRAGTAAAPADTTAAAPPPAPVAPPAPEVPAFDAEPDQPEFRPRHVEEPEPEIVHSSADPGAVEGAGANLRVDEPWPGYGKMTAVDIVDRLAAADRATLATVQLYEATHRKRTTVLTAVDRSMSGARS